MNTCATASWNSISQKWCYLGLGWKPWVQVSGNSCSWLNFWGRAPPFSARTTRRGYICMIYVFETGSVNSHIVFWNKMLLCNWSGILNLWVCLLRLWRYRVLDGFGCMYFCIYLHLSASRFMIQVERTESNNLPIPADHFGRNQAYSSQAACGNWCCQIRDAGKRSESAATNGKCSARRWHSPGY